MSASEQPRSLRAFCVQVLQQLLPALVVYFGLRAFGVPAYLALVATVAFAIAHMVVDLVRGREADFFILAIIVLYGVSAIITLVTHNPRYSQLANMLPGTVINSSLLISPLFGKPLTKAIASKYNPNLSEGALAERGWGAEDIREYTAMHTRVSLTCGAFGVLQVIATLVVIFTCSVDVAQLVCDIAGTGTTLVIILYAIRTIRRFVEERSAALHA